MIDENYIKTLEAQKLSDDYIRSTKWALKKLDDFKPLDTMNRNDLMEFFKDYRGAESSLSFIQTITKKYFNFIGKSAYIDWLKATTPREKLNPKDILTTDDVNKMIETSDSHFYKALIAFLFETGCRISEARALKYKDFIETDSGLTVNINTTKTGAGYRKLILPFAGQYIRNLKSYTNKNVDEIVFNIGNSQIGHKLKEIAEKAGIKKPISPHKFRHAQATDMVKRGYNEAVIRKKHGWTAESNMIARYQHIDDNDVINATLEKSGKYHPSAKQLSEIKEAEELNIVDQGMILSKLINENDEIKDKFEEYDRRTEDYNQRLNEKMDVNLRLIQYCLEDEDKFKKSEAYKHLRIVKNDW